MNRNKVFITTSNGVYRIDPRTGEVRLALPRRRGWWIFRRGGMGFFGIDFHEKSGRVIAASRERLGTPKKGKPTTDMKLYAIDPDSLRSEEIAEIRDVHDVHQIAITGDTVFLTDCGLNRVPVYDLIAGEIVTTINIGTEREDINHVNAVHAGDDELLIGLNNRGERPAEIIRLDMGSLEDPPDVIPARKEGEVIELDGIRHTHDIEPAGERLLVCSSFEGIVYDAARGEKLFHVQDWTRGIAVGDSELWVGSSEMADRSKRHREDLDGAVHVFEADEPWRLIRSYQLEGAGQVNDIILV